MATEGSSECGWNIVEILPPEITVFIFSNVPLRDIARISVSCKTWNNYSNEESTWKKIFELKYSTTQINSSLHNTLSWRRLFYGTRYASKWSKKNSYTAVSNEFVLRTRDLDTSLTQSGKYHVFASPTLICLIDIALAGKLVTFKKNPLSLHAGASYGSGDLPRQFKAQLMKHFDFRAPKNGKYTVPDKFVSYCRLLAENGSGDLLVEVSGLLPQDDRIVLWQAEVHGVEAQKYPPILSILKQGSMWPSWKSNTNYVAKFNKNYVALLFDHAETKSKADPPSITQICIIDLSKRCLHCNPMHHSGSNYDPELKNCNKECAIVYQGGKYKIIFASQLNPDVIVALFNENQGEDWELTIWNQGQIRATLPFKGCKGFNNPGSFYEHCTDIDGVKRHWFGALTSDAQYLFIDLNDLTTVKTIEAPGRSCLAWVPNENKVALGTQKLVTILDLDTNTWYSTMEYKNYGEISCLSFSKSGEILFMTTNEVYACYWRSGQILNVIADSNGDARTVNLALDQILIVADESGAKYYKLKSKLEI